MSVSVLVPISIFGIDIQRYAVSGCRYRILISKTETTSSNRYRHVDVGIGYCRFRGLFRTLTVPDTVAITDTDI